MHHPLHSLHLIESLGAGGAERLLYTNLKYLTKDRARSRVITLLDQPDDWAEPMRALGISVESLGCSGLRDILIGVARLRKWLRANRPDVIHTHLWAANVVGRIAGRLSNIPVISSVHNPDYDLNGWNDSVNVASWKRQVGIAFERWSAWFGCTRMIAVSDYARRYAHRRFKFPLARIDLIYNPIDTESFAGPPLRQREELLRELQLSPNSQVLLHIGRVAPQKGLIHAIGAMPAILARHADVKLLSVGPFGDGIWLDKLKGRTNELAVSEQVHFVGLRSDVNDFLRACDVFVFPSIFEGLGIALIEAMAAGTACVASDVGPIPEVVTHGVDGWLVPPGDEAALAEAVCALLDDPERRRQMGQAAAASALSRFQPSVQAEKLLEIYELVVGRASQSGELSI